ncbi:MAG TPA: hypothetical protein PKM63_14215 [Panacibacter sp.]|nr:hypothetical protein [Panacibacter sp.]HNP45441.1 hypothetical protein [Panacibacter sp.]
MKQVNGSSKRNLRWYMRYLHNKIGFFITGLVIIYSLSGLVQTYRDTDFLKHEVTNEKRLVPGLSEAQLGPQLRLRDFKVIKTAGDTLYFKDGKYNSVTGQAVYTSREWYAWIKPFTDLHKSSSKDIGHYFTTIFGFALFFMSISAFWMFKPGTKAFSRGVLLTVTGVIASVLLLLLQ